MTADQIADAKRIGQARCEAKPPEIRRNDSGFHSNNNDRSYPHMIGAIAELAYAFVTDQEIDRRIFDGGDSVDFSGIEVKSSTWVGDDIELKIKKSEYERKKPIGYVLCRVDPENWTVEFMGCIDRKTFDKIKYPRKHKYVDNWCVEAKSLIKGIVYIKNGKLQGIKIEQ